MASKSPIRGALMSGGDLRLWTGVPIGLGVTYVASKVMPSFTAAHPALLSPWLFPIPYRLPALAVGAVMLASKTTRRAGYGVLGTTVAYYVYSAMLNYEERLQWEANQTQQSTEALSGIPARRR